MLAVQGGTNIIDENITITPLDSITFEIDLSTATTNDGFYEFTVQAANIEDLTGTAGEVGEQVSWTQSLSVPSVLEFTGLLENGVTNEINSIQVLFNMPVNPTTFTAEDVVVLFEEESLTGTISISALNEEGTLFEITGINTFVNEDGTYNITVDNTGIESFDGTVGLAVQAASFAYDTKAPSLINLLRFNEGGLDEQHYIGANLNFDEEVMLFDTTAITLFKDGVEQYVNPAEIILINPSSFEIKSFEQTTYPDGDYELAIDMSMITDLAGNVGSGIETTNWSVNRTSGIIISGLSISPDMGHSLLDGITATKILDFSFGISEAASLIEIYQNDIGTLTLLATLNDVDAGNVTIPLDFATGGNTAIYMEASDENGNVVNANFDIYIDESALTANWELEEGVILEDTTNLIRKLVYAIW